MVPEQVSGENRLWQSYSWNGWGVLFRLTCAFLLVVFVYHTPAGWSRSKHREE